MKKDDDTWGNVEGLKPAYIEGKEAGSTYKVIARTPGGYVAVRRLSAYYYRVRCERFDKQFLVQPDDKQGAIQLATMNLNVADGGRRISGTGSTDEVVNMAGVLASVLFESENVIGGMEPGQDEAALKADAKLEAKKAAKVAKALAENTEEPIVVNGKAAKGMN